MRVQSTDENEEAQKKQRKDQLLHIVKQWEKEKGEETTKQE